MPVATNTVEIDNNHYFKYMKKHLISAAMMLLSIGIHSQNIMNVMSYNAENLFDTVDNPEKNDDEFTPAGDRRWTQKRYWSKLSNLSRVIVAMDEDNAPELVGLCEVENDSVMYDLTRRSSLKNIGYDYEITHSPDERGINVALLYKKTFFRKTGSEELHVDLGEVGGGCTRNVLHVTGRIQNGDTLDVYVCHWPSRIGGEEESEPRRKAAAAVVRASVDSVFAMREKPYVIIMGDLNEGPDDPAVRETLCAHPFEEGKELSDRTLVTVVDNIEPGSYRYEGEWDTYDQFVVSASFLNERGCTLISGVRVGDFDFLLTEDNKYGKEKPLRTYNGYRYQNGFSDHLPVALDLSF